MEGKLKRLVLAGALVLTAFAAHADTSTYVWLGKGQWTDAKLQAAAHVCDLRFGVVENGAITSASYKSCMLKQGWKYQSTARTAPRANTYIDSDTGMSCQDVGGGSLCFPPQGTVHYQNRHGLNCTRTGIVSVCSNL
jgi:hypothetical protein